MEGGISVISFEPLWVPFQPSKRSDLSSPFPHQIPPHSIKIISQAKRVLKASTGSSPMVGIVVTISPSFSLYRIVVLPAASSPTCWAL